jgi:UDP-N-acetylglucosamine:LPS N-acetylglucosamine transferase
VFEALAVARALVARGHPPDTVELVGSRRGQESTLLADVEFPVALLPGRGIARSLSPRAMVANAGAIAGLVGATARMVVALARRRPAVVVSVGGYASFPASAAAVALRVPLVLVNIDAVPGLVHRLLGRCAAASAVAFPDTELPRAVVTGTPVRDQVRAVVRSPAAAATARSALGLPPGAPTIGVVGGSLGARRLNEATVALAELWANRADRAVYHVTGRRSWNDDAAATGPATTEVAITGPADGGSDGRGPAGYRRVPFEDRMDLLYEAADVMVCRAGAVTVAELAAAGVPAVLVPLPGAPGDHQTANARALEAAGAAVVVPDTECTGRHLAEILDRLLGDGGRLGRMGAAARAAGRPDAAERVAELVDDHAR